MSALEAMVSIYLDVCCLARLTDDQSQQRIREEAAAIERIFAALERGDLQWVASEALAEEIARNPAPERRVEAETLLALASDSIVIGGSIASRARYLESAGYGSYDALHIAAAESAFVDAFLTTDDKLIRRAARGEGRPLISIQNPLSWEQEDPL